MRSKEVRASQLYIEEHHGVGKVIKRSGGSGLWAWIEVDGWERMCWGLEFGSRNLP